MLNGTVDNRLYEMIFEVVEMDLAEEDKDSIVMSIHSVLKNMGC